MTYCTQTFSYTYLNPSNAYTCYPNYCGICTENLIGEDFAQDCSDCNGLNTYPSTFVSSSGTNSLNALQAQVIAAMANFTYIAGNLSAIANLPDPGLYGSYVNDYYPISTCNGTYGLSWIMLPQSGAYSCEYYCQNNVDYVRDPFFYCLPVFFSSFVLSLLHAA